LYIYLLLHHLLNMYTCRALSCVTIFFCRWKKIPSLIFFEILNYSPLIESPKIVTIPLLDEITLNVSEFVILYTRGMMGIFKNHILKFKLLCRITAIAHLWIISKDTLPSKYFSEIRLDHIRTYPSLTGKHFTVYASCRQWWMLHPNQNFDVSQQNLG